MTRYTVVWDKDVKIPFTRAWVDGNSQTRAALTELANWLDKNLAHDPDRKGRLQADLAARQIEVPLSSSGAHVTATYRVVEADRLVRIVRLAFRAE